MIYRLVSNFVWWAYKGYVLNPVKRQDTLTATLFSNPARFFFKVDTNTRFINAVAKLAPTSEPKLCERNHVVPAMAISEWSRLAARWTKVVD